MSDPSANYDFNLDEQRAFNIVSALCHRPGERAKAPTITFVIGQQGAGKSTVIQHLMKHLPPGEAVTVLDTDTAAMKFPGFKDLARIRGYDVAEEISKPFMRKCMSDLAKIGFSSRAHIIIETADPNIKIEPIAASFAAAGYKSKLLALAVPDYVSRQATAVRQAFEVEMRGFARRTPRAEHEEAYRKWPGRLAGLIEQKVFSSIQVVSPRRGTETGKPPAMLSSSERIVTNGRVGYSTVGLKPLAAFIDFRALIMTDGEKRAFQKRWRDLESRHPAKASVYAEERKAAANLFKEGREALLRRELTIARDGLGGLRSQVYVPGARERLEALDIPFRKTAKQKPSFETDPLVLEMRAKLSAAANRRQQRRTGPARARGSLGL